VKYDYFYQLMEKERYLSQDIIQDLNDKMVFIGGARQVGKTTLATKLIAPAFREFVYYNWDYRADRKKIMDSEFPGSAELIVLDEIHKYKKWKNLVKGQYDVHRDKFKFLITGSARLNIYRKGSDSLQGRYHYYTLHPFTLAEIINLKNKINIFREIPVRSGNCSKDLDALEQYGGFPEVFLKQNDRALRRWHNEKTERLLREEIRNVEAIRDIGSMQLLADLLPSKVGSLFSLNSVRDDLEVSYRAVSHWVSLLEQFYYHFRIYPHTKRGIRSIKKTPKLYLYDWSEVSEKSARFENLIASHLLKLVQYLKEADGYKAELNYLRNVDKKEVDFLVSIDKKPWFCVEAKLQETKPAPSLFYFKDRLRIPYAYQVVKKAEIDVLKKGIRIVSADRFLSGLL
jgi:predicted AAA+ superfamily ATPase